jgi:hypothetical protein
MIISSLVYGVRPVLWAIVSRKRLIASRPGILDKLLRIVSPYTAPLSGGLSFD